MKQPEQALALMEMSLERKSTGSLDDTIESGETCVFADVMKSPVMRRSIDPVTEFAGAIEDSGNHPIPVTAETVFTEVAGKSAVQLIMRWGLCLGLCAAITIVFCAIYYLSMKFHEQKMLLHVGVKESNTSPNASPPVEIPKENHGGPVKSKTHTDNAAFGFSDGTTVTTFAVSDPSGKERGLDKTAAFEEWAGLTEVSDKLPEQTRNGGSNKKEDEILEQITESGLHSSTKSVISDNAGDKLLLENIEIGPKVVEISSNLSRDEYGASINMAYTEFMENNYGAAEAEYQKVLAKLPDNRDALLGLAAIAHVRRDLQGAYEKYLMVLKYYPKDSVAKTALINLQGNIDSAKSESVLKLLIKEEPETPFLYFSLGNLYAAQSRWNDAQQFFSDAYRLDEANPDYAFNLAVCLDQLGEGASALDYYKVALELADETRASFDTALIMSRINTLSGRVFSTK